MYGFEMYSDIRYSENPVLREIQDLLPETSFPGDARDRDPGWIDVVISPCPEDTHQGHDLIISIGIDGDAIFVYRPPMNTGRPGKTTRISLFDEDFLEQCLDRVDEIRKEWDEDRHKELGDLMAQESSYPPDM